VQNTSIAIKEFFSQQQYSASLHFPLMRNLWAYIRKLARVLNLVTDATISDEAACRLRRHAGVTLTTNFPSITIEIATMISPLMWEEMLMQR
jgi:hypothetical protein